MASWRRKVIESFPTLRWEAQRPHFTIYSAFRELLPMLVRAHRAGDKETLSRIYGFAEWCSNQQATDLWNAAGVSFYEHLFDSDQSLWADIVSWLSPQVIAQHMGLWEYFLSPEHIATVKRLIDSRNR